MIRLLIIFIIFLIIDLPWLFYFSGDLYTNVIKNIQGSSISFRPLSALVAYILLALGIRLFVIDKVKTIGESIIYGGLFGLITYGIFDFTNIAIFEGWTYKVGIIDMIWGTIICSAVSLIIYLIINYNKDHY